MAIQEQIDVIGFKVEYQIEASGEFQTELIEDEDNEVFSRFFKSERDAIQWLKKFTSNSITRWNKIPGIMCAVDGGNDWQSSTLYWIN